jgi:hypothetical protein
MPESFSKVEVITGVARRRRFTMEQKRRCNRACRSAMLSVEVRRLEERVRPRTPAWPQDHGGRDPFPKEALDLARVKKPTLRSRSARSNLVERAAGKPPKRGSPRRRCRARPISGAWSMADRPTGTGGS